MQQVFVLDEVEYIRLGKGKQMQFTTNSGIIGIQVQRSSEVAADNGEFRCQEHGKTFKNKRGMNLHYSLIHEGSRKPNKLKKEGRGINGATLHYKKQKSTKIKEGVAA